MATSVTQRSVLSVIEYKAEGRKAQNKPAAVKKQDLVLSLGSRLQSVIACKGLSSEYLKKSFYLT